MTNVNRQTISLFLTLAFTLACILACGRHTNETSSQKNETTMKIGIIVAMDKEFAALKTLLTDTKEQEIDGKNCITGSLNNKQILLMHSGIGKVNAAIGTVNMINAFHPDIIISSGCAGGADINLEIGNVVVSTSCGYHDVYCGPETLAGQIMGMPHEFESPKDLVEKAVSVGAVAGKIATGDWFVDTPQKMAEIHATVPEAKAVDMESCAIAQTCYLHNVKFVSFRVISDIPLKEGNTEQYLDFWATMAEKSFTITKEFLTKI